jgi:hypothetical protein
MSESPRRGRGHARYTAWACQRQLRRLDSRRPRRATATSRAPSSGGLTMAPPSAILLPHRGSAGKVGRRSPGERAFGGPMLSAARAAGAGRPPSLRTAIAIAPAIGGLTARTSLPSRRLHPGSAGPPALICPPRPAAAITVPASWPSAPSLSGPGRARRLDDGSASRAATRDREHGAKASLKSRARRRLSSSLPLGDGRRLMAMGDRNLWATTAAAVQKANPVTPRRAPRRVGALLDESVGSMNARPRSPSAGPRPHDVSPSPARWSRRPSGEGQGRPLRTDQVGRDELASSTGRRCPCSSAGTGISLLAGTTLGFDLRFWGGPIDRTLSRITDIQLAFSRMR